MGCTAVKSFVVEPIGGDDPSQARSTDVVRDKSREALTALGSC